MSARPTAPDDGDDAVSPFIGTGIASAIGAVDNEILSVGVAPGARLWAVNVLDSSLYTDLLAANTLYNEEKPWTNPEVDLTPYIAGVEWVTDHADEIEVADISTPCTTEAEPERPKPLCSSEEDAEALEAAIAEAVEAGVVFVSSAATWGDNVESSWTPVRQPEVITASGLLDTDGKPGGEGPSIGASPFYGGSGLDHDDTSASGSGWGTAVDIAAPSTCATLAGAYVSGAAAILASMQNPESAEDVGAIGATLFGESECWGKSAPATANGSTSHPTKSWSRCST